MLERINIALITEDYINIKRYLEMKGIKEISRAIVCVLQQFSEKVVKDYQYIMFKLYPCITCVP